MTTKEQSAYKISFNTIQVNSITNASGIFVGNNTQMNWSSHNKENIGFGTVDGNQNRLKGNHNIVIDPDVIDHPVHR